MLRSGVQACHFKNRCVLQAVTCIDARIFLLCTSNYRDCLQHDLLKWLCQVKLDVPSHFATFCLYL